MKNRHLYKAKRLDNGEWVKGHLITSERDETKAYIGYLFDVRNGVIEDFDIVEVIPSTLCQCTGKNYMDSDVAYEGDIFESQVSGELMILRYGTYQAYYPVDKDYMDSVGFYAECRGYPEMPIGCLKDYALKKGNIFDNLELLEV